MTPDAVRRRFVLINALTWLPNGLYMAPFVLLMVARDIDLATIGIIVGVFSVAVAALELPTGGLADAIGRRGVLAAAGLIGAVSLAWMAFATGPWEFIAVAVLRALARALSSGPAEAWYVDAVHASDPDADLRRGLAHGKAAAMIALAAGTLTGGLLPQITPEIGPVIPLAIPVLFAVVASVLLFVVALIALPERQPAPGPVQTRLEAAPRRARAAEVLRDVPATVGRGLRLGIRDRVLTRVLAAAFAIGVGINAIEMLTPGRLADLTGTGEAGSGVYAIVVAAGFAASAVSSPLAIRFRSPARAAIVGTCLAGLALLGLAASTALTGAVAIGVTLAAYVVMFTGIGVMAPVRSEIMHQRVTSAERATVLSIDSLLLQAGAALAAVALGWLASATALAPAWCVAGAVVLAAALLFVRLPAARRGDPQRATGDQPARDLAGAVS